MTLGTVNLRCRIVVFFLLLSLLGKSDGGGFFFFSSLKEAKRRPPALLAADEFSFSIEDSLEEDPQHGLGLLLLVAEVPLMGPAAKSLREIISYSAIFARK